MNFHFSALTDQDNAQVLRLLDTSKNGLTTAQVQERKKKYKSDQFKKKEAARWWHILFRQLISLYMIFYGIIVLLFCFLGEYTNALIILFIIVLNTSVGFYQEYKAVRALAYLKELLQTSITVIRDGIEQKVVITSLVPGDLVLLSAGDRLPADVRLIEATGFFADESALTGESKPVSKMADPLPEQATELFKAKNIAFASSVVISGKAKGVVTAIGIKTVVGEIVQSIEELPAESTLSQNAKKIGTFIFKLTLITLGIIFVINLLLKRGTLSSADLFIFSITLALSVMPEALPVVITFCLSRGATILAKESVVVKRLSAIEDLGSIAILCTDKTGTLTENIMAVKDVHSHGVDENTLLLFASLASEPLPVGTTQVPRGYDGALFAKMTNLSVAQEAKKYTKLDDLPFDSTRLWNGVLMEKDPQDYVLIYRGALEALLARSINITDEQKKEFEAWATEQGILGRRLLSVAYKQLKYRPDQLQDEGKDLAFLGTISFEDPLKKTTKEAIEKAKKLGITIKIISGDTPEVCGAVARSLNLIADYRQVVTGTMLAQALPTQKTKLILNNSVFARVSPDQKFEIVKTLQEYGIVGYMGDGINDVPALRVANVSLVVQGSVDLAQEAADIILLRKSLLSVINGIEKGRMVTVNTMKYLKITLSANFGNFYALAISSMTINYLPMLPIQILLVNLLTDFPMISISTDNVTADAIAKPTQYSSRHILLYAFIFGMVSSVFDFICFVLFAAISPAVLRTSWFIESVLTELALIFSLRSNRWFSFMQTSPVLALIAITVAIITIGLPYTSLGQHFFAFAPIQFRYLMWVFGITTTYFVVTEFVKMQLYRRFE